MPEADASTLRKDERHDEGYRCAARRLYGSDSLEIEDDAPVVPVHMSTVAWVQAWVRVSWEEVEWVIRKEREESHAK